MQKEMICKCGRKIDMSAIPTIVKDKLIKNLQELDLEDDKVFDEL